jgi:hypothetical protein
VVLVNSSSDSRALRPLTQLGAQGASLRLLPDLTETVAVVEGTSRLIRELRRRIAGDARVVVVRPSGADTCRLAGVHLQMCLTPVLDSTLSLLRGAGLTGAQASRLIEAHLQFNLRAFRKAGRRSARYLHDDRERRQVIRQLNALYAVDPEQARFLRQVLAAALRRHRADAGWLPELNSAGAARC